MKTWGMNGKQKRLIKPLGTKSKTERTREEEEGKKEKKKENTGANDIEMDASYASVISILPLWLLLPRGAWLPFRPPPRGPWG